MNQLSLAFRYIVGSYIPNSIYELEVVLFVFFACPLYKLNASIFLDQRNSLQNGPLCLRGWKNGLFNRAIYTDIHTLTCSNIYQYAWLHNRPNAYGLQTHWGLDQADMELYHLAKCTWILWQQLLVEIQGDRRSMHCGFLDLGAELYCPRSRDKTEDPL